MVNASASHDNIGNAVLAYEFATFRKNDVAVNAVSLVDMKLDKLAVTLPFYVDFSCNRVVVSVSVVKRRNKSW